MCLSIGFIKHQMNNTDNENYCGIGTNTDSYICATLVTPCNDHEVSITTFYRLHYHLLITEVIIHSIGTTYVVSC